MGSYTATVDWAIQPGEDFVAGKYSRKHTVSFDAGITVPAGIAIAAFDDFSWADLFSPRLTAIAQPSREIGAAAVRLLLSRIEDPAQPPRTVRLTRGFSMSGTEVTVDQFTAWAASEEQIVPPQPPWNRGGTHPIVNVTWQEASNFCRAAGGRLPSEAEWEYAARGGASGQVYPWGDAFDRSRANGLGQGGNITIGSDLHPLSFLVLSDGQIRADAFGGPGGNIRLFADTFLSSGSILSASSALSAPGTIAVQAQFTDLSNALVQLPADVLQAAALLRASCATRLAEGKASSLVVAGREGVPPEPDRLLSSFPLLDESGGGPRAAEAERGEPAPLLTLRWPTDAACR